MKTFFKWRFSPGFAVPLISMLVAHAVPGMPTPKSETNGGIAPLAGR
jgi:hypothetical protein